MKKVGIIYTGRRGDIVGTLPRSKWWADQGFEVIHYVAQQYDDLLKFVSYVKPRVVEGDIATAYYKAVELAKKECDVVEDRQIFPRLYGDYRGSGKTWLNYYYADRPELANVPPQFDVEYPQVKLPSGTVLVSMHGISSGLAVNWRWVEQVVERLMRALNATNVIYTCHASERPDIGWPVDHTPAYQLPALMKTARCLLARNSAPAWMAYGVGIPTLHLPDSCFPSQDTCGPAPNLIRLPHGSDMDVVQTAIDALSKLPWNGGR